MVSDALWMIYFPAKLVLYVWLVHYGLRAFGPPAQVSFGAAATIGMLRLIMGFMVAIPLGMAGMMLYDILEGGVGAVALTYILLYPPVRWIEWGVLEYLIQSKEWALFRPSGPRLQWRAMAVVLTCLPDVVLFVGGPEGPFRIHMC